MGERARKLLTTSLSDQTLQALDKWCKKHGYRIADALELGVKMLPAKPPPPPPERRGRPKIKKEK